MQQPLLFSYFATFIARDVVFYTITTISTSIISIQNIDKFIIDHKDNDYIIFSNQLEKTDLVNKLIITSSIIKDIFKKHSSNSKTDFDKIFNIPSVELIKKIPNENEPDYDIVSNVNYSEIEVDIPEPVRISILSTLETIHKINLIFDIIHKKIISYNKSYFNFYKLNISEQISQISHLNVIFNSRLDMLFKIINIYNDKI